MLCKDYNQSEKKTVSQLYSIFRYLIIWLAPLAGTLLWLAIRAYLVRSGLPAISRENLFDTTINLKSMQFSVGNLSSIYHIINPLLTKLVRSRRLDLELGQYPAILTSRAVNNPYIFGNTELTPLTKVFDETKAPDLLVRSLADFFLAHKTTSNLACRPSPAKLRTIFPTL